MNPAKISTHTVNQGNLKRKWETIIKNILWIYDNDRGTFYIKNIRNFCSLVEPDYYTKGDEKEMKC